MITESAIERLTSREIRPSLQRIAVMQYLLEHRTHPTVDQIFTDLQAKIPTLSRTTVYNTLKLLCEKGAVLMLDIDQKQTHYDGDISLHGHFLCTECGSIEDVFHDDCECLLRFAPQDADVKDVQLLYKGVCKYCKKN